MTDRPAWNSGAAIDAVEGVAYLARFDLKPLPLEYASRFPHAYAREREAWKAASDANLVWLSGLLETHQPRHPNVRCRVRGRCAYALRT